MHEQRLLTPRLGPPDRDALRLPARSPWRLRPGPQGSLDALDFAPHELPPLAPDEVTVEVRAAGINFRDALIALGYDLKTASYLGYEGAGIVARLGEAVEDLKIGQQVFGILPDAFADLCVVDRGLIAPIPLGWSFATAAMVTTS